jgi:K+-transporting ATPase KdpF subunit
VTLEHAVGLAVTLLLLAYLGYALIHPEKF